MPATIIASVLTALITAVLAGLVTFAVQERKLRAELRTEFMAEHAARSLLENERWTKRSFEAIKNRLGGFGDDELWKILVRAGAVRFESSQAEELWGLTSRNEAEV